jgi:hypothetical protein
MKKDVINKKYKNKRPILNKIIQNNQLRVRKQHIKVIWTSTKVKRWEDIEHLWIIKYLTLNSINIV